MGVSNSDIETSLIQQQPVATGAVNHNGRPVRRQHNGGWKSASFIIGVEVAERLAYYGIATNLINYLTGPIGQPMIIAAKNVNVWCGFAMILPTVGAFVADSFFGRFRTILIASVIYIIGLGLLTLSCILLFAGPSSSRAPNLHVWLFFFSLYIVAIGQGGHKPCVQAFGADQFDEDDPEERKAKSSFFNWWYFCICGGLLVSIPIINYIQDNLNWALGFGIPCISMMLALFIFLLGAKTYRVSSKSNESKTCATSEDVEETKAILLKLVPIWATCLVYALVLAQCGTFFIKQGTTLDRSIWRTGFNVPAASLQLFIPLTSLAFIPIYDRLLVPLARGITQKPSGITMLERISIGMLLSVICMVIAALVEQKRLDIILKYSLANMPEATIPMAIWWLVPQYIMLGVADVFALIGLQEFFYDQVPSEMRSIGMSLYLSIFGVGNFLSSFLITWIEKATGSSVNGEGSWFSENINKAHMNLFYWLLATMGFLAFILNICFAKAYIYRTKR